MLTLYIYNPDTMRVLAKIIGDSNDSCERKAAESGYDANDNIAWTYSPALGVSDGLVDSVDAEELNA